MASWYGGDDGFEGKPTASGEIYDSSQMTAAHRELPLGTRRGRHEPRQRQERARAHQRPRAVR